MGGRGGRAGGEGERSPEVLGGDFSFRKKTPRPKTRGQGPPPQAVLKQSRHLCLLRSLSASFFPKAHRRGLGVEGGVGKLNRHPALGQIHSLFPSPPPVLKNQPSAQILSSHARNMSAWGPFLPGPGGMGRGQLKVDHGYPLGSPATCNLLPLSALCSPLSTCLPQ